MTTSRSMPDRTRNIQEAHGRPQQQNTSHPPHPPNLHNIHNNCHKQTTTASTHAPCEAQAAVIVMMISARSLPATPNLTAALSLVRTPTPNPCPNPSPNQD